MNIIFTVNTYYPYKDGVQAVTTYQAEGLAKRGHSVTVITSIAPNAPIEEVHNGVKIIRIRIYTKHAIHRGNKKEYQTKILELCQNADVVINVCMQTGMTDWMLPILDKIKCVKFLYMHGMVEFNWSKKNFRSPIALASKIWNNIRWSFLYHGQKNNILKYDAISQLHEFDAANLYFKRKYDLKCMILGNAADDDFFSSSCLELEDLPKQYILLIANYIERKNQMQSLEVFYESDVSKDWGMIFIGSEKTSYYDILCEKKKILEKKYGNKDVRLLVNIPRERIPSYVKNSDLYLMSSNWEAFPISIIETMAAGIPFLSTDAGCVRFLPGGIIAKTRKEMIYWMNVLTQHEQIRKKLGDIGREYANYNYRIELKVSQLENKLIELINKK